MHSRMIFTRFSFDFLAIELLPDDLKLYPLAAGFIQHGFDPFLIDGLDRLGRNPQGNPSTFFGNVEAFLLQVYLKPTLAFVVGMRNAMPRNRPFSRQLISARHDRLGLSLRMRS